MKYLLSLTIIILFTSFSSYQATAQTIPVNICSLSWWQQFIQGNTPIARDSINLDDLSRSCDQDENTPLMVAHMAGADNGILQIILRLAVTQTLQELILIRDIHGQSFPKIFLERQGPGYSFFLSPAVYFTITTEESDNSSHHPIPPFLSPSEDICDILWWQQLELADDILIEDISHTITDDLFTRCNDNDKSTPLMIALKANISDETIMTTLNLITINTLLELFDNTKNIHGQTLSTMLLKEYGSEVRIIFNADISYRAMKATEEPE